MAEVSGARVVMNLREQGQVTLGGLLVAWLLFPLLAMGQTGFERVLVTVDDSPVAQQYFAEAIAQATSNPERSAALAEALLQEYRGRLLGVEGDSAAFKSVRSHVIDLLQGDPVLEAAWRERARVPSEVTLQEESALLTFDQWPLTEAGLEAGLRTAQLDIEHASFTHALRVLDEIDSWRQSADDTRRIASLRATAAGLAATQHSNEDRREFASLQADALATLARFDAEDAASIKAIVTGVSFDEGLQGVGSTDRSGATVEVFGEKAWARIWDDSLHDTLFRRRYFDADGTTPTSRSRAERARNAGSSLTSVPVVIGDVVLVNEGLLLHAWDRLTGRMRWARSFGRVSGLRPSGAVGDLGEITARGAAAITVVGHAFGDGRDGSGEILRFDPKTSRERWRVKPEQFLPGKALKDVFISGPPLIEGDIVAVPLRKVNSRLETIDYVAGLDLDSGATAWVQLIASSGGVRMGANRPFSRLASLDGDIMVSSAVGAVARLDSRTGNPRWLRRFSVPLRPQTRNLQPWEIGGPVVLKAGVACLSPGLDEWLLLDEETGAILKQYPIGPGTVFDDPYYLLAFGPDEEGQEQLIGVGRDIIAIDPMDGTTRLWALSTQNRALIAERPNRGDRHGVRGRVHALGDALLVPFGDAISIVGVSDGIARHVIPTTTGGNPVVAGNQFFLASDEHLHAYMPLAWAVAALRARLEGGEAQVDEALALLDLARRSGDVPLAMEATELAVASLEQGAAPDIRSEVLERLLGILDEDLLPLEEAERIHAFAERIASTPSEHVRRLLAQGDWSMRYTRPREAVESWQTLLRTPTFSSVWIVERNGIHRSAGTAAASRIETVRNADPAIAQWLESDQERLVKEALASRATAEELLEIVRAGSGSPTSYAAGVRAVEILRDEQRVLEAIGAARMIARESDLVKAKSILGLAAEVALNDKRFSLAALLRQESEGGTRDQLRERPLPRIATTGTPPDVKQFEGHLPVLRGDAVLDAWADRFLLVDDRSLICRDASDHSELWRVRVEDPKVEVLRHEPSLLLWIFPDGDDATLQSVNSKSGEVEWTIEHLNALLPTYDDSRMSVEGTRPNRTPFLPWRVEPVLTDHGIVAVRADGALALVSQSGDATVHWTATSTLNRVYGTLWDSGLVHLWGVDVQGDEPTSLATPSVVVSIDPASGREISRVEVGGGEPRWLTNLGHGQIAFATARELVVIDPLALLDGEQKRWRRDDLAARDTREGWSKGDHLIAADQMGVLVAFEETSGMLLPNAWRVGRESGGQVLPVLDVASLGDLSIVAYPDRLFAFSNDGRLVGADAIADAQRSDWKIMPARDSIVLVSRHVGSSKYLYRVHRLDPSAGLKLQGTAFDVMPPSRSYNSARLVDGWLLLGTSTQVDAISLDLGMNNVERVDGSG